MNEPITFPQFMELQAQAHDLAREFHGSHVEYDAQWDGYALRVGCDQLGNTSSWVVSKPLYGINNQHIRQALFFNRSALSYLRTGLVSEDGYKYQLLWRIAPVAQPTASWEQDMRTYVTLLTRAKRLFKEEERCVPYAL